jgi:hypothetical protein
LLSKTLHGLIALLPLLCGKQIVESDLRKKPQILPMRLSGQLTVIEEQQLASMRLAYTKPGQVTMAYVRPSRPAATKKSTPPGRRATGESARIKASAPRGKGTI